MHKGKSAAMKWSILAVLVVGALLASAVAAGPSLAAKGGNASGKGHRGTTYTATCSVTPNPTPQWDTNAISGSGFLAYTGLGITVRSPSGDVAVGFAVADANGSFSTMWQGVWLGTNTVTVSGSGVSATCTFEVV